MRVEQRDPIDVIESGAPCDRLVELGCVPNRTKLLVTIAFTALLLYLWARFSVKGTLI